MSRVLLLLSQVVTAACFVVHFGGPTVLGENVDLSTVPDRETVQLTIYNSADLTLVRETRKVSFKQGINPLQFSWSQTLIDPTSVELRFLSSPEKLEILDTTFPHDKPQMLYWNVQSEIDGEATVEISYFTSGISWSADYVGVANVDESEMRLEGFVRVVNNSGEPYDQAQVRLVVGRVNLVEQIAQLANMPMSEVEKLGDQAKDELQKQAVRQLITMTADAAGSAATESAPKEIIKEGLSEYFLFTIEGTETIPNGWSKRMRSFKPASVPIQVQYRYREQEYGPQLVRMYLLRNDKESGLGESPLPDGQVRLFRDNSREGLSFVSAQQTNYLPIGDLLELNLGPDPAVIFELVRQRMFRDEIWMQIHGTETFRRVEPPGIAIEVASSVAGYNEHGVYVQRIRNYTERPIDVQIRRSYAGHILFRSGLGASNHDYQTVEFATAVPAATTRELAYEVVQLMGRNHKQDHVVVENAEVTR